MRFFTAMLLSAGAACAQGLLVEPRVSIGSDFQAGGRVGVAGLPAPLGSWSAFLDGEFRPVPSAVRIRISPTLTHQYRESRYSIGAGLALSLPMDGEDWYLVPGAGVAYTSGWYSGTAREPGKGWTGWGELGLRYATDGDYYWEAAGQYRPLPGVAPLRLVLKMGWNLR